MKKNALKTIIFRYKWHAVNCFDPSVKYMCMIKVPNCPYGYTWVYQLGQACIKVTPPLNQVSKHFTQLVLCGGRQNI